jgi:hypothetical protein
MSVSDFAFYLFCEILLVTTRSTAKSRCFQNGGYLVDVIAAHSVGHAASAPPGRPLIRHSLTDAKE